MQREKTLYLICAILGLLITSSALLFGFVPQLSAILYRPDYKAEFVEQLAEEMYESSALPVMITTSKEKFEECRPTTAPAVETRVVNKPQPLSFVPIEVSFYRAQNSSNELCVLYIAKAPPATSTTVMVHMEISKAFGERVQTPTQIAGYAYLDLNQLQLEHLRWDSGKQANVGYLYPKLMWVIKGEIYDPENQAKNHHRLAIEHLRQRLAGTFYLRLWIVRLFLLPLGFILMVPICRNYISFRQVVFESCQKELGVFPCLVDQIPSWREFVQSRNVQDLHDQACESIDEQVRIMKRQAASQAEHEKLNTKLREALQLHAQGSFENAVIQAALEGSGTIAEKNRIMQQYGRRNRDSITTVIARTSDPKQKLERSKNVFSTLAAGNPEPEVIAMLKGIDELPLEQQIAVYKDAIPIQQRVNRKADEERINKAKAVAEKRASNRPSFPMRFITLRDVASELFNPLNIHEMVPEDVDPYQISAILKFLADLGSGKPRVGMYCRSRMVLTKEVSATISEVYAKEFNKAQFEAVLMWLVNQGVIIKLLESHEEKYSLQSKAGEATNDGKPLIRFALQKIAEFKSSTV